MYGQLHATTKLFKLKSTVTVKLDVYLKLLMKVITQQYGMLGILLINFYQLD